ncbi:MAG TPA: cytochrome c peroxidase [Planctomycetota bacterium]|jgi:cytochrome c peroxidase|nr:cytochrome c peroxidase [Planctomycetota bacterium]
MSQRLALASAASLAFLCAPTGQEMPPLPRHLSGQGAPKAPADNPTTPEKVALGKTLFFDGRLSKSGATSCETCHVPEKGWADGLPLSKKDDGSMNTRHSPTLYDAAYADDLYWDGRAAGLEKQVLAAWKGQMGADPDAIAKRLAEVPGYGKAFERAFGGAATADGIVKALSAFVRTILPGDAPWDRYEAGEKGAVAADVVEGFRIFTEVANCSLCHVPPLYTDTLFHNVGVGFDGPNPDLGRGKILADAAAKEGKPVPAEAVMLNGAFKTPTLRAVTESAPYFHDGKTATLEAAVDFLLKGGTPNPQLDPKLKPKSLSEKERAALLAFVRSLTPPAKPYERPPLP